LTRGIAYFTPSSFFTDLTSAPATS